MNNNFENDIQKTPFLFLQYHPDEYFETISKQTNAKPKSDKYKCYVDRFKNTFFSESNITYIQKAIAKNVYERKSCEKYIISEQKHEHLVLIMQSIYDNYAQNIQYNKKEQFQLLNKMVVDYCSDEIVKALKIRMTYLSDKFSKPKVMPDPISTTVTGSKSFLPLMSNKYDLKFFEPSQTPLSSIDMDSVYNQKIIPDKELYNGMSPFATSMFGGGNVDTSAYGDSERRTAINNLHDQFSYEETDLDITNPVLQTPQVDPLQSVYERYGIN
jgi:hypothetical protein